MFQIEIENVHPHPHKYALFDTHAHNRYFESIAVDPDVNVKHMQAMRIGFVFI